MKVKILAVVAAILCVVAIWRLMPTRDAPIGGLDARMEKLRADGDVEALSKEAASKDIPTARRAVESMGFVGFKALKHIRVAMEDPRPAVRQKAVTAYATAAKPKSIAPVLKEIVRTDNSPIVRATAVTALGRERVYEEMETLLAAMNDDDIVVRRRAAEAVVLMIGRRYPYKPHAPSAERLKSIAVIRKFWIRARTVAGKYYDRDRIRRKKEAEESQ